LVLVVLVRLVITILLRLVLPEEIPQFQEPLWWHAAAVVVAADIIMLVPIKALKDKLVDQVADTVRCMVLILIPGLLVLLVKAMLVAWLV
jgi:hypothetical protein